MPHGSDGRECLTSSALRKNLERGGKCFALFPAGQTLRLVVNTIVAGKERWGVINGLLSVRMLGLQVSASYAFASSIDSTSASR